MSDAARRGGAEEETEMIPEAKRSGAPGKSVACSDCEIVGVIAHTSKLWTFYSKCRSVAGSPGGT